MPNIYNILAVRGPLHVAEDYRLVRDESETGSSIAFNLGGLDASFQILDSASGNLKIQANNMSPANTSFSSSWFDLVAVTGNIMYIISTPVRFIKFKSTTGTLTSNFSCVVFSSGLSPYVD